MQPGSFNTTAGAVANWWWSRCRGLRLQPRMGRDSSAQAGGLGQVEVIAVSPNGARLGPELRPVGHWG